MSCHESHIVLCVMDVYYIDFLHKSNPMAEVV